MSEEKELIKVIKTKPMRSTTQVEGILVNCSNNKWYAIMTMQPSRNPWFMKSVASTSTGKSNLKEEQFSVRCPGPVRPDSQKGIEILLDALNGAEVPHDKIVY